MEAFMMFEMSPKRAKGGGVSKEELTNDVGCKVRKKGAGLRDQRLAEKTLGFAENGTIYSWLDLRCKYCADKDAGCV
jgi:hypothetical protein